MRAARLRASARCCPRHDLAVGAEIPRAERRSSYDHMSPETKAMQDDDTANPGMLWVLDGEALWSRQAGAAGRSCADCHGDASGHQKGVAARHPAFDAERGGRSTSKGASTSVGQTPGGAAAGLREQGAVGAFRLRRGQSRGMPNDVPVDERGRPSSRPAGPVRSAAGPAQLYCAQCHDDNGGSGSPATPSRRATRPATRFTGWNGRAGSLQRRLRNRWSASAPSLTHSARRTRRARVVPDVARAGMTMETPAVRP